MIIWWICWNQKIGWYEMILVNPNQLCPRLDSSHAVMEVKTTQSCYTTVSYNPELHIDGLVPDYSISIAIAMEILRSCIKSSILCGKCIYKKNGANLALGTCFVGCIVSHNKWWRHQMETFPALLAICAGNSPVTGEFPAQSPVMRSFDVFFDLRPNKRLSKQSWAWWF